MSGDGAVPTLMCVSLGPWDGILVFNSLVLYGALGGLVAAALKWVIEVTKLAEMRRRWWAIALWKAIDAANMVVHRHVLRPAPLAK